MPLSRCDVTLSLRLPAESLRAAHSGPLPFQRDGCLFLHKDALYQAGSTPLVLVWKDAICRHACLPTCGPQGICIRMPGFMLHS